MTTKAFVPPIPPAKYILSKIRKESSVELSMGLKSFIKGVIQKSPTKSSSNDNPKEEGVKKSSRSKKKKKKRPVSSSQSQQKEGKEGQTAQRQETAKNNSRPSSPFVVSSEIPSSALLPSAENDAMPDLNESIQERIARRRQGRLTEQEKMEFINSALLGYSRAPTPAAQTNNPKSSSKTRDVISSLSAFAPKTQIDPEQKKRQYVEMVMDPNRFRRFSTVKTPQQSDQPSQEPPQETQQEEEQQEDSTLEPSQSNYQQKPQPPPPQQQTSLADRLGNAAFEDGKRQKENAEQRRKEQEILREQQRQRMQKEQEQRALELERARQSKVQAEQQERERLAQQEAEQKRQKEEQLRVMLEQRDAYWTQKIAQQREAQQAREAEAARLEEEKKNQPTGAFTQTLPFNRPTIPTPSSTTASTGTSSSSRSLIFKNMNPNLLGKQPPAANQPPPFSQQMQQPQQPVMQQDPKDDFFDAQKRRLEEKARREEEFRILAKQLNSPLPTRLPKTPSPSSSFDTPTSYDAATPDISSFDDDSQLDEADIPNDDAMPPPNNDLATDQSVTLPSSLSASDATANDPNKERMSSREIMRMFNPKNNPNANPTLAQQQQVNAQDPPESTLSSRDIMNMFNPKNNPKANPSLQQRPQTNDSPPSGSSSEGSSLTSKDIMRMFNPRANPKAMGGSQLPNDESQ